MKTIDIISAFAPILSRYVGMLGLLWECIGLKILFNQDPNAQALLIFGGMVGASLFNQEPKPLPSVKDVLSAFKKPEKPGP